MRLRSSPKHCGRCAQQGIQPVFIQPGKPNQNANVTRVNRSFQADIVNVWLITTLDEIREQREDCHRRYDTEWTHDSLDDVQPLAWLPRASSTDVSHFKLCA
jgi:putative transposase